MKPSREMDAGRPIKRSFAIKGHRTSISLEAPFWDALKEAAQREEIPLATLVARIDAERGTGGLSSAVRIWLLAYFRTTSAELSYDGGNRD